MRALGRSEGSPPGAPENPPDSVPERLTSTIPRRLQAQTADERLVAIENQYGQADLDHLTRGLAYAVGHNAPRAIALRIAKPVGAGTVAALTVQSDGTIWINRGYLVTAFHAAGVPEQAVDRAVDAWPGARRGAKNYHLSVDNPTPEACRRFTDALWGRVRDTSA